MSHGVAKPNFEKGTIHRMSVLEWLHKNKILILLLENMEKGFRSPGASRLGLKKQEKYF